MDKPARDLDKRKIRLPTSNVDTTINELRFKKKDDDAVLRKTDSLSADEEQGVVERIVRDAIEDTRGRPITKAEEIGGICKRCKKTIRKDEAVECNGRCGELLCEGCYQKQGSHVLYGRRYCRWDYWCTKLFWRLVSPSLRKANPEKPSLK